MPDGLKKERIRYEKQEISGKRGKLKNASLALTNDNDNNKGIKNLVAEFHNICLTCVLVVHVI